jgi:hypothetical protein
MRIEGTIRPAIGGAPFSREDWCELVRHRPEFRPYPPRQVINPFTRAPTTVHSPEDMTEVWLEDSPVGRVYWSMSEEPLVNVSVEPSAKHLVLEWAKALGGEFREDK